MKTRLAILLISVLFLSLTACDLVENENTKTVEVEKLIEADVTAEDVLMLLAYFGVSPDSDPLAVTDVDGLITSINKVFGLPDDEPVDVREGDTIADVFARASGG